MARKGTVNNTTRQRGRPKGSTSKVTKDARKAVTLFVEGNIDKLNRWLSKIEQRNGPKAAFECFMSVVEYHIPKLERITHVGEEDKPIGVMIVDDIPKDKK